MLILQPRPQTVSYGQSSTSLGILFMKCPWPTCHWLLTVYHENLVRFPTTPRATWTSTGEPTRERVPFMGTSQGNLRRRPRAWTPRIGPAKGTCHLLRRISASTCSDRRPKGVRNRVPRNFIYLSVFLALELVPCSVIGSVGEDPKASYSVFCSGCDWQSIFLLVSRRIGAFRFQL